MYEQYGTKEMKADSKRSLKEYRERAFYKKHFVLGRLRQKGDEKSIQLTTALLMTGLLLPATIYS